MAKIEGNNKKIVDLTSKKNTDNTVTYSATFETFTSDFRLQGTTTDYPCEITVTVQVKAPSTMGTPTPNSVWRFLDNGGYDLTIFGQDWYTP